MRIVELNILQVRNLINHKLLLHPKINILYGKNGSGKTSVLEAIHTLSLGKSFRSHKTQSLINYFANELVVSASIKQRGKEGKDAQESFLGIKRTNEGVVEARFNTENIKKISTLTNKLPVQVLHPESFRLFITGPEERREFLDWGPFHVKPLFAEVWRKYKKALLQRNNILKNKEFFDIKQLAAWDQELSFFGQKLTTLREEYITEWLFVVQNTVKRLLPDLVLQIKFFCGWDKERDGELLSEVLVRNLWQDRLLKSSQKGPHRADLLIEINGIPAGQVLSRGQQKRLICALYLAQLELFIQYQERRPIVLLDDLSSELDSEGLSLLMLELIRLEAQSFITIVSPESLANILNFNQYKLFQVVSGMIIVSKDTAEELVI